MGDFMPEIRGREGGIEGGGGGRRKGWWVHE